MKYLRSFNENINNDIDAICKEYEIKKYTINDDGTIDVDGDVDLSDEGLIKLPLMFRNVSGDFKCYGNQLTSLKGSPQNVGVGFYCSYNQLTSLKYCPLNVGDGFYCNDNQLTSLRYCPKSVGKDFVCSNNQLTSLKYIPKRINGVLYCSDNKIKNIDYLPYYKELYIKNNPISLILNLFDYDIDLIFDFKEREIIQEDILLMDRLVEFLEDIDIPETKEYLYELLENDYEIR